MRNQRHPHIHRNPTVAKHTERRLNNIVTMSTKRITKFTLKKKLVSFQTLNMDHPHMVTNSLRDENLPNSTPLPGMNNMGGVDAQLVRTSNK